MPDQLHHLQRPRDGQQLKAEHVGPVHLLQVWDGDLHVQGPKRDIIAKEFMLDWSAYQEVKLDTKLVTSLGRDMLLTL